MNLKELEGLSDGDLKKEVGVALRGYKGAWEQLGAAIYEVKRRDAWQKWAHKSFEAFCDSLNLGVDHRTVMYWLSIITTLHIQCGVPLRDLAKVGVSKCIKIVPLATPATVLTWLKRAEEASPEKLQAQVAAAHKGKDPDTIEFINPKFQMTPEQLETIRKAMAEAGKLMPNGRATQGHALEMICIEFLGNHPDTRREAYSEMIEKLEQVFHVKLVAVDCDVAGWEERYQSAKDAVGAAAVEST